MEIAKVKVSGVRCTPVSVEIITRGMAGATVSIEYTDPLWDKLTKTVVFRGACTKDVLNAGNVVTVPAEVVATAGKQLFVGVYGVDADNNLVIPTLWAELGTIVGAASPSGDSTTEPTPPVWAQIQAVANNAEALAKSVREDADAGAFIGPVGPTGAAAEKISDTVEYQSSTSGDTIPSGTWSTSIPPVLQGEYLWTRTTTTFNTGTPVVSYSVTRFGIDGTGSVSSVCGISPDGGGNVPLTAENVGALPNTGGDMTGSINMNGQAVTGLNAPTEDTDAARKGYVDSFSNSRRVQNLLDNSDFRNPVNQRGQMNYENLSYQFFVDRWKGNNVSYNVGTRIVTVTNSSDGKFYQNVPTDKVTYGKKVTFAVCINGEVFTVNGTFGEYAETANKYSILKIWGGSSSDEAFPFEISFQGQSVGYAVEIDWAALYEGEYTAETLPPYVPKGYGAELAECRRYYQCYDEVACANIDAAYPILGLTFPPMRVTPTLTIGSLVAGDNLVIDGIYVDSASVFKTAVTTLTIGGATGGLVYKARNVALSADL